MKFAVGTSGWHYNHWQTRFYPPDISKAKWLEFYAQYFSTVEINASFYRLPTEKAFAGWRDATPPGFLFAVKASRLITHYRRLVNVDDALETFLGRARILANKLGPILYQLPPGFPRDEERLESFLSLLPKDLQHALEFRHQSWFTESVYAILRKHNVAFCVFSRPNFQCPIIVTADISYVRFHGSTYMYGGCYSDTELERWAQLIRELGRETSIVYAYFNNDAYAHAVHNALTLMEKLGLIEQAPSVAPHD